MRTYNTKNPLEYNQCKFKQLCILSQVCVSKPVSWVCVLKYIANNDNTHASLLAIRGPKQAVTVSVHRHQAGSSS